MSAPFRVPVNTASPYEVTAGTGLLPRAGEWLAALHAPCTTALVADDTVDALYGDTAAAALEQAGFTVCRFTFPHGEESKTMGTLAALLEFLADRALTGGDLVAALGGGVTGDLAGFAAAVYRRGIPFVQMPTTLLAAVDAAVGGKTAVDLAAGKNLAGAFHQPLGVLCDTDLFATLPAAERQNGMAEVIKSAMIGDPALFAQLENGTVSDAALVAACVRLKAALVAEDEHDRGARRLLNFGHTVGHAAETLSRFTLPHGRAVAMGMAVAARAALADGLCSADTANRLLALLRANSLPTGCPYPADALAAAALADKKRTGDRLTLVLPEAIGHCRLSTVGMDALPRFVAAGWEADA